MALHLSRSHSHTHADRFCFFLHFFLALSLDIFLLSRSYRANGDLPFWYLLNSCSKRENNGQVPRFETAAAKYRMQNAEQKRETMNERFSGLD